MDGYQSRIEFPAQLRGGRAPSPPAAYRARVNASGAIPRSKARASPPRRIAGDSLVRPSSPSHQPRAARRRRAPGDAVERPTINGSYGADARPSPPAILPSAARMADGGLGRSGGNPGRAGKERRPRKNAAMTPGAPLSKTLRAAPVGGYVTLEKTGGSQLWAGHPSDMPMEPRFSSPIRRQIPPQDSQTGERYAEAVGRPIIQSHTLKDPLVGRKILESQGVGRHSIRHAPPGSQGLARQGGVRQARQGHPVGQSMGHPSVAHRPALSCVEDIFPERNDAEGSKTLQQQWLCGTDNPQRAAHRPKDPSKNWMAFVGRQEQPPSLEPGRYAWQARRHHPPPPLDTGLKRPLLGGVLEPHAQRPSSPRGGAIPTTAPQPVRIPLGDLEQSQPLSRLPPGSAMEGGAVTSPARARADHRKRSPSAPVIMKAAPPGLSLRLPNRPLLSTPQYSTAVGRSPRHGRNALHGRQLPPVRLDVQQSIPGHYKVLESSHPSVPPPLPVAEASAEAPRKAVARTEGTSSQLRPVVAPGLRRRLRQHKKIEQSQEALERNGHDEGTASVAPNFDTSKPSSKPPALEVNPSSSAQPVTRNGEEVNGMRPRDLFDRERATVAASKEPAISARRSSSRACRSSGAEVLSENNPPSSRDAHSDQSQPPGTQEYGSLISTTPELLRAEDEAAHPAQGSKEGDPPLPSIAPHPLHAETAPPDTGLPRMTAGEPLSLRISPARDRPPPMSHSLRPLLVSTAPPREPVPTSMGADLPGSESVRTPREVLQVIQEGSRTEFSTPETGLLGGGGARPSKTPSPLSRPSASGAYPQQRIAVKEEPEPRTDCLDAEIPGRQSFPRNTAARHERPLTPPPRQSSSTPPIYHIKTAKPSDSLLQRGPIGGSNPVGRIVASKATPVEQLRSTATVVREYYQRQYRPAVAKTSKQPQRQNQSPIKHPLSVRYRPNEVASMIPRIVPRKVKDLEGRVVSPPAGKGNERYRVEKLLQKAIYGGVYAATELAPDGRPLRKVALKAISKQMTKSDRHGLQENPWAEVKFYQKMVGHRNVLVFDSSWEDADWLYLVMGFAEYQDLFELLKVRKRPLSEPQARWIFRQIIDGAVFLHQRGIGFRDHSLENILIFLDPTHSMAVPKITDPGQAVFLEYDDGGNVKEMTTENLFGKSFRAPEVYLKGNYHPFKIDTFCLGWMLFFTVTRSQAFERALYSDPNWNLILHGKIEQVFQAKNGANLSRPLKALLAKMLHPDPRRRPTPAECLEQPWFTSGPETPIYLPADAGGPKASASSPPPHPLGEAAGRVPRLTPAVA